jgi:hypothetical protein
MKKLLLGAVSAAALLFTANAASANCDDGEMVIKFSHVVAATGHPKGDAATLLAERVNSEMNGKACMEVFAELDSCSTMTRFSKPFAGRCPARSALAVEVRSLHAQVPPVRPAVPVCRTSRLSTASPSRMPARAC